MVDICVLEQTKEPRTDYFMAATDKASGTIIGEAILHVRSIRWRQGEVGWGIRSDYIGRGLGTEIGLAMIRFAFDDLDLHRVFCPVPRGESGLAPDHGQARHARRKYPEGECLCPRLMVVIRPVLYTRH
jgi:Acetyltransferase (GNAT) domain